MLKRYWLTASGTLFACVLGTTYQVPDVHVTSSALRRAVLVHGVLSFFFNAVVIALTVNAIGIR
jgi:uncharacterized membrane protein